MEGSVCLLSDKVRSNFGLLLRRVLRVYSVNLHAYTIHPLLLAEGSLPYVSFLVPLDYLHQVFYLGIINLFVAFV